MSRLATILGAARRRLPFLLPALAVGGLGLALCGQGLWIHAKAALAQVLLERAFDQSVRQGGAPVRPWSWADTWPTARLTFPNQDRRIVVLDGASGQALAFGPGHVAGTPQAGDRGTAVYAAHRDTHFAVLGAVRPGDPILVERADGKVARFEVVGAKVVRWDASGVTPRAPGRGLALATCWPLNAKAHGPLRYVVWARLVGASPDLTLQKV